MELIHDLDLMTLSGLQTPFVAGDPLYSPIARAPVMTHRVYPGLCGFVPVDGGRAAVVFVDALPADSRVAGTLRLTSRINEEGGEQECWVVQVESAANAWQFMTLDEELKLPLDRIVLCQWKPGALSEALELHDAMIASLGRSGDAWIIGSELEVEAHSRYILASGLSSIGHALAATGTVDVALKNLGNEVFLKAGICTAVKALPISWYTES